VTVELGGAETEVSRCINCEGAGSLTCTTCQGSGIQPRYLDRRYGFLQSNFSPSY
jgi:DnaJ-class molecular chaperone